jgi:hypothetical protein
MGWGGVMTALRSGPGSVWLAAVIMAAMFAVPLPDGAAQAWSRPEGQAPAAVFVASVQAPARMPAVAVAVSDQSSTSARSEADRLTRLAREDDPICSAPWVYSRGLNRCICVRQGYSLQWGQCLPMPGAQAMLPAKPAAGPKDEAKRMEATARAQDCLATLGL